MKRWPAGKYPLRVVASLSGLSPGAIGTLRQGNNGYGGPVLHIASRWHDEHDIVACKVAKDLRDLGVSWRVISNVTCFITGGLRRERVGIASSVVVLPGAKFDEYLFLSYGESEEAARGVMRSSEVCICIPIGRIWCEMLDRLDRIDDSGGGA